MPYARKYNYKGIETVWANAVTVLQRDVPVEIAAINLETGGSLSNFGEYLKAEKIDPADSFIIVQPDTIDTLETDDASAVAEENTLDITFAKKVTDDTTLEQLTKDILRYDRAVRNVLWSATEQTVDGRVGLLTGVTHTPAWWDIRGGQLRWGQIGGVKIRAMAGIKLVFNYSETRNG